MTSLSLGALMATHAAVAEFLAGLPLPLRLELTLDEWLAGLGEEELAELGLDGEQLADHVARLMDRGKAVASAPRNLVLRGGRDRHGRPEVAELILRPGQTTCIVGPTGSGKSRLLADIECLAQGDTPTGRVVLVDGAPPSPQARFAPECKLVAQLSQNMNFVVDLPVAEFVAMHAQVRGVTEVEAVTARVIACANDLTGEKFAPDTALTQLSGGQTRALMIADVALLSESPVVLIDEIENAGVDRSRALGLLVAGDKIVLVATHDPLLALRGDRRVVLRGGGIAEILETSAAERRALQRLERVDAGLMELRDRLRHGGRIEEDLPSWS